MIGITHSALQWEVPTLAVTVVTAEPSMLIDL